MRNDDPLGCAGWPYCIDCGGVCATDELDRRPYQPHPELWKQAPVEVPGEDYLDRFANYRRPKVPHEGTDE